MNLITWQSMAIQKSSFHTERHIDQCHSSFREWTIHLKQRYCLVSRNLTDRSLWFPMIHSYRARLISVLINNCRRAYQSGHLHRIRIIHHKMTSLAILRSLVVTFDRITDKCIGMEFSPHEEVPKSEPDDCWQSDAKCETKFRNGSNEVLTISDW
jgi:hypothetical protein